MTSKWIDEKAQLEHLILVDKLSYEEIGRRMVVQVLILKM